MAVAPAEFDAASRLVHRCYVDRGYEHPSADGRHNSPYFAIPSTSVFVACANGTVVATVSLFQDSEFGLPCDELYAAEIGVLRRTGLRVGEVSALAISENHRGVTLDAMSSLIHVVGVYGRDLTNVDYLCAVVHPRHASFYERRLQFQRFGGLKPYAAVNGAPAIGLLLDLRAMDRPLSTASYAGNLFGPSERARTRARLRSDCARVAAQRALESLQSAPEFLKATPVGV